MSLATPSIAVLTRRVTGMVSGSILSPWAANSRATSAAALAVGSTTSLPVGVLTRLPSSRTENPSASGSAVTVS